MSPTLGYCAEQVREHDKDRFLATLFAPADRRDALFALTAFVLEIERVAFAVREPMAGEVRLQWWLDVLAGTRVEEAQAHPVAAALREAIVAYDLPHETLAGFVEAHAFDLYVDPMATWEEFEGYAARTAGAVMRLAASVLADAKALPDEAARHAGFALTAARVLRLLPIHAARGQLFIPLTVLRDHGVADGDVFARRDGPGLRASLSVFRDAAFERLDALNAYSAVLPEAAFPVLLPVTLARGDLLRMTNPRDDPFTPRELPRWRRQWILWRAARRRPLRF